MLLEPIYSAAAEAPALLRSRGYAVVSPAGVCELAGCAPADLQALVPSWDDLPPDTYLRDGGRYRRRRHSCFVVDADGVTQAPHRAHWQPVEYNALHGGMQRWFEPMQPEVAAAPAWLGLLRGLARVATQSCAGHGRTVRGNEPWYLEAHQFRIDTTDGIGRPTPEGAHRDGVDLVAVFLVARKDIKGGETRVFEADGPAGLRFTLGDPWSLLLLDDARVVHETTPIQPTAPGGYRDTLVLTCRGGGFQGD